MNLDALAKAESELSAVIGHVILTLAEVLDAILDEVLVIPEVLGDFFMEHILGTLPFSRKVDLLRRYAKSYAFAMTDPDGALRILQRLDDASSSRNRLVHDLHEIDITDGRITLGPVGALWYWSGAAGGCLGGIYWNR